MTESLHDLEFPGESPEYREHRDKLLQAEIDLRARIEEVASLRRELPKGGKVKEDYVFERIGLNGQVEEVRLSELFDPGKFTLVIYNYMFGAEMASPCVSCTAILDSTNGNAIHVSQRLSLAVVAKSPANRVQAMADERGWSNLRMLSSANNTYNADYFGENASGAQLPMCNIFVKRADGIYHFWGTEMLYVKSGMQPRHMDLAWPLWNFLDMTPEGRGADWYPKLSYD